METFDQTVARLKISLESQNMEKADIETALKLFRFIVFLDSLVFAGCSTGVILSPKKSKHASWAQYCCPLRGRREHYTIFVPGLDQSIRSSTTQIIFKESTCGRIKLLGHDGPRPSLDNILFGIAIHEVRHRMQFHIRGLRQFNPWTYRQSRTKATRVIGKYVKLHFYYERKYRRRDSDSEDSIDRKTNNLEFDCKVVELCFLHRSNKIVYPADVLEHMYIQPEPRR